MSRRYNNNYNYNYNSNYNHNNYNNYHGNNYNYYHNNNNNNNYYYNNNNNNNYNRSYHHNSATHRNDYITVEIPSEPQAPLSKEDQIKKEEDEYNTKLLSNIETYLQSMRVKVSPMNFMKYCQKDPENIKTISTECKLNTNYMVIDISMNPKGIDEEKVYLTHPQYTTLIRRGNSLLEKYQYNYSTDTYTLLSTHILRKGMKKFVDLPFNFFTLSPNTNKCRLNLQNQSIETENTLKYIFYPVIRALNQHYLVEIIKLMKANGENAQISYTNELHSWVIASKNVCILATNRNDIETYYPIRSHDKPTRYAFASKIAYCWFDIIDTMDITKVNQLKQYLTDKTLIGEYVGNQYHQHLIRYMKHTILFFGIVENNNALDNSIPIIKAFKILREYNLDVVPYEYIGAYSTFDDVCKQLKQLYIRIAESSIIDEEEGSVIYLTQTCARSLHSKDEYRKDDQVLSLCKLKTWEYRIYRKLREKIKNNLLNENYFSDSRRKISQFFDEIRIMLQGFSLPMPLEFYYKVGETAFDYIDYFKMSTHLTLPDLHSTYIDFLETVHSIVDQTVTLKSRVIKQDNIMTYDTLIQNTLKARTVVEIIIYAPPLYISNEYLKEVCTCLNATLLHCFIADNNYININNNVVVYYINMHNFRNVTTLARNKFIYVIGLNENEINKCKEVLREKMKNPLFKTYNTNKSMEMFINYKNMWNSLDDLFEYYVRESKRFVEKVKKNFNKQVKEYNVFNEGKDGKMLMDDMMKVVEEIKGSIGDISEESVKMDCFFADNKTLISVDEDYDEDINNSNNDKGNNVVRMKDSKYKGSDIIDLYEEHVNMYEKEKENFLKWQHDKIQQQQVQQQQQQVQQMQSAPSSTLNTLEQHISPINNSNNPTKKVIVLIPMTIPGNGKTFFINQLRPILLKYNVNFFSISSDIIRREIMNEMLSKNYRLTETEAFSRSGPRSNYVFEDKLQRIFESIYFNSKITNAMIYIDKNHPTNAINRSTEPIRSFLNKHKDPNINLDLKFIALIPDCICDFEFMKNDRISSIPFSLSYFIQCYLRVKHRDDHPTLNGNVKNLITIFGIFIQNFIDLKLNESSIMLHQKLDGAFKLPFTDEINESLLPKELVECASEFFASLITQNRNNNNNNNNNSVISPIAERFECMINYLFPKGTEFFSTKNLVSTTAEPIVAKIYSIEQHQQHQQHITSLSKVTNFLYLGILIKGEKNYVKFKSKLTYAFKLLLTHITTLNNTVNSQHKTEIESLIACTQIVKGYALPNGWKYPHNIHKNLWHCTTLFKGSQPVEKVLHMEEYKQFELGKSVNVKVIGVVYLPMKIVVSLVKLGEECLSVNKYTHVTTFINGFAPKKANDVTKALFDKGNDEVKEEYMKRMAMKEKIEKKEDIVKEKEIEVDGVKMKCYVVIYGNEFVLNGMMYSFE